MNTNTKTKSRKQTAKPYTPTLEDDVRSARLILFNWGQADEDITLTGTRAVLEALAILVEAAEIHSAEAIHV